MNVNIQNFTQLNEYLEKAEGKLRNRPEKEAATREKIQHVVRGSLDVVDGSDFKEVGRFLQSVKQIAVLGEGEGLVKMAIDAVANSSRSIDIDAIGKFKELDEVLYYESLAIHISTNKLPIKSLGLSEEEMLKVMPWVTYLDLTDASDNDYGFEGCTLNDQFLEKLLENASNLKDLIIKNSNINGSVFAKIENSKGLQNLETLKIINCPALNEKINGLPNLKNLTIEGCSAFNQSVNEFTNLESLIIEDCNAFNQSVNELPSLKSLTIGSCRAFNQSINELPILEALKINGCRAFNQSVNELPSLETLKIDNCNTFNKSVNGLPKLCSLQVLNCTVFNESVNELPGLKNLTIGTCSAFNSSINALIGLQSLYIYRCNFFNQSIKELPNINRISIAMCGAFNQSLNELPSLFSLNVSFCPAFNQSINGLQGLRSLSIDNCSVFNQSISELPNLQRLEIRNCNSFEINDIETVFVLYKFTPEIFKKVFAKKLPDVHSQLVKDIIQMLEEKTKIAENLTPEIIMCLSLLILIEIPEENLIEFQERIPSLPLLLKLYGLDELVRTGGDEEEIKKKFLSFKGPNYFNSLLMTIEKFPELTSFLIRNLKEEIIPDLKSLNNLDQLPLESKIALLPLFSPDQIEESLSAISEEIKAEWLEEDVDFEEYAGSVEDVLTQIAENNIQGADQQARDNLLIPLKELLVKIPFHVLAVLSTVIPETMLAYMFVMEDAQMASVIPMIPEEALMEHLKTQSIQTHREYLLYASTRQKEAYIAGDLFKEPESLTGWDQGMTQIEELTKHFENEKSKGHFQELESAWREIVNNTNLTVQTYEQAGQAVEGMLLKFSPNEEYANKVTSYFAPKMKHAAEVLQGLKTTGKKIEALEGQVLGHVETPEEYVDSITGELMTSPHHHSSTPDYIYDLSTWKMLPTHPATRAPINLEELIPDTELQGKIEAFREKHPEL